jgi:hypothetical protein
VCQALSLNFIRIFVGVCLSFRSRLQQMTGELQKTNYVLGAFMLAIVLGGIAQIIYYVRR